MSSQSDPESSASVTAVYDTPSLDTGTFAPFKHAIPASAPAPSSSSSMHNSTSSSGSTSSFSLRQLDLRALLPSLAAHSSSPQSAASKKMSSDKHRKVVAIKTVNASNDKFFHDNFLSGDVVLRVGCSTDEYFTSPFPAGKQGLMEELHNFHRSGVSILTIHVKRLEREIIRRALIVPTKKKYSYVLQDFDAPSHVFTFENYTAESCATMQAQGLKDAQEHLSKLPVAAVDMDYPWEKAIQSEDGSGMIHSMLLVPHARADVLMEDTVLQALTWLQESKKSGIPLLFRSIQTEPLITEASEHSLNVNISHAISSNTYVLEHTQGNTDRFVVTKALRIWFAFRAPEIKVELEAMEGETLLGVIIARTAEGFCHVTEVVPDTAAARAGLRERLDVARELEMKLVVTKVGNERVLPWLVSRDRIRCYDINSIRSKLSAFRRACKPACLHLLDITYPTLPQAPGSISSPSFNVDESLSTSMEF